MCNRRRALSVVLCLCVSGAPMVARTQTPAPPMSEELTVAAAGWAALGAGKAAEAAAIGAKGLDRYPRSATIASLLVSVEAERGNAAAALAAYERWLGSSSLEDPYLLRPVALALLREMTASTVPPEVRRAAFRALADAGDVAALAELGQRSTAGGLIELEVLAARGSEPAIRSLIASVKAMPGDKGRLISALVDTRSQLAVAPLTDLLKDPNPDNRAAAADGLGRLGATGAATALRPLLNDAQFSVKFATARALYRLHDYSGVSLLQTLQTSEAPLLRVQALEAMSSEVGPPWIDAVRVLLSDADPQVRLLAARLIAPYDSGAASAAFNALMTDSNIAIQEAAGRVYVEQVVTDVAAMRRYFRSGDPLTRVTSANRLLELTR
ncbi:MAG: HEAT repeat domain-containing protein [Vicinamibacterales bacterium]